MSWATARDDVDEMQHEDRNLGHAYGYPVAGTRNINEMVEATERPTVRAPPLTIREQVEQDKWLREIAEWSREK